MPMKSLRVYALAKAGRVQFKRLNISWCLCGCYATLSSEDQSYNDHGHVEHEAHNIYFKLGPTTWLTIGFDVIHMYYMHASLI
jgi:hypothetical protein